MDEMMKKNVEKYYLPLVLEERRKADEAKREADEAERRADEIAEDFARFLLQAGHSLEEKAELTRLTISKIQDIAAQMSKPL